jgi:hypothetical protein
LGTAPSLTLPGAVPPFTSKSGELIGFWDDETSWTRAFLEDRRESLEDAEWRRLYQAKFPPPTEEEIAYQKRKRERDHIYDDLYVTRYGDRI